MHIVTLREKGGDWEEDLSLKSTKTQVKNKCSKCDTKGPTRKRRKVTKQQFKFRRHLQISLTEEWTS